MKTYKAIQQAFSRLVKRYRQEVKDNGYDEYISNRYLDKFDTFVGYFWAYDYFTRQNILKLRDSLFNCVVNPIG